MPYGRKDFSAFGSDATMNSFSAADPMVRLQDVKLTLKSDAGEVNILRGIDLSVNRGETVGVVGPSGSGKTSLIMIIAGLEQITGGQIWVAGREISALDEDGLAIFRRDEVGVVPGHGGRVRGRLRVV